MASSILQRDLPPHLAQYQKDQSASSSSSPLPSKPINGSGPYSNGHGYGGSSSSSTVNGSGSHSDKNGHPIASGSRSAVDGLTSPTRKLPPTPLIVNPSNSNSSFSIPATVVVSPSQTVTVPRRRKDSYWDARAKEGADAANSKIIDSPTGSPNNTKDNKGKGKASDSPTKPRSRFSSRPSPSQTHSLLESDEDEYLNLPNSAAPTTTTNRSRRLSQFSQGPNSPLSGTSKDSHASAMIKLAQERAMQINARALASVPDEVAHEALLRDLAGQSEEKEKEPEISPREMEISPRAMAEPIHFNGKGIELSKEMEMVRKRAAILESLKPGNRSNGSSNNTSPTSAIFIPPPSRQNGRRTNGYSTSNGLPARPTTTYDELPRSPIISVPAPASISSKHLLPPAPASIRSSRRRDSDVSEREQTSRSYPSQVRAEKIASGIHGAEVTKARLNGRTPRGESAYKDRGRSRSRSRSRSRDRSRDHSEGYRSGGASSRSPSVHHRGNGRSPSASGSGVVPRRKSKTLCKFFPKGECQKGEDCPFVHDVPVGLRRDDGYRGSGKRSSSRRSPSREVDRYSRHDERRPARRDDYHSIRKSGHRRSGSYDSEYSSDGGRPRHSSSRRRDSRNYSREYGRRDERDRDRDDRYDRRRRDSSVSDSETGQSRKVSGSSKYVDDHRRSRSPGRKDRRWDKQERSGDGVYRRDSFKSSRHTRSPSLNVSKADQSDNETVESRRNPAWNVRQKSTSEVNVKVEDELSVLPAAATPMDVSAAENPSAPPSIAMDQTRYLDVPPSPSGFLQKVGRGNFKTPIYLEDSKKSAQQDSEERRDTTTRVDGVSKVEVVAVDGRALVTSQALRRFYVSELEQIPGYPKWDRNSTGPQPATAILVTGMHHLTKDEHIRQHMKQFGNVESVVLGHDSRHGQSLGICRVIFGVAKGRSAHEAAHAAVKGSRGARIGVDQEARSESVTVVLDGTGSRTDKAIAVEMKRRIAASKLPPLPPSPPFNPPAPAATAQVATSAQPAASAPSTGLKSAVIPTGPAVKEYTTKKILIPAPTQESQRAVYCGNLNQLTYNASQFLDHIRFGPIDTLNFIDGQHCAFLTFLKSETAYAFLLDTIANPIFYKGKKVNFNWGKPHAVPYKVEQYLASGHPVSRAVEIGNLPPKLNSEGLRAHIASYGAIDQITIDSNTRVAYIDFLDVISAINMLEGLPYNPAFKKLPMAFGIDRCQWLASGTTSTASVQQVAVSIAPTPTPTPAPAPQPTPNNQVRPSVVQNGFQNPQFRSPTAPYRPAVPAPVARAVPRPPTATASTLPANLRRSGDIYGFAPRAVAPMPSNDVAADFIDAPFSARKASGSSSVKPSPVKSAFSNHQEEEALSDAESDTDEEAEARRRQDLKARRKNIADLIKDKAHGRHLAGKVSDLLEGNPFPYIFIDKSEVVLSKANYSALKTYFTSRMPAVEIKYAPAGWYLLFDAPRSAYRTTLLSAGAPFEGKILKLAAIEPLPKEIALPAIAPLAAESTVAPAPVSNAKAAPKVAIIPAPVVDDDDELSPAPEEEVLPDSISTSEQSPLEDPEPNNVSTATTPMDIDSVDEKPHISEETRSVQVNHVQALALPDEKPATTKGKKGKKGKQTTAPAVVVEAERVEVEVEAAVDVPEVDLEVPSTIKSLKRKSSNLKAPATKKSKTTTSSSKKKLNRVYSDSPILEETAEPEAPQEVQDDQMDIDLPDEPDGVIIKSAPPAPAAPVAKGIPSQYVLSKKARRNWASAEDAIKALDPDDEDLYLLSQAIKLCSKDGEGIPELPLREDVITEVEDPQPIEEGTLRKHTTGSARTEGYYKVSEVSKTAYLPSRNKALAGTTTEGGLAPQPSGANAPEVPTSSIIPSSTSAPTAIVASSRSARVNTRRLVQGMEQHKKATAATASTSSNTNGGADATDVFQFNQLRTRKKQLKFQKSPIHDWGLYAVEAIPMGEMVIEYVGEVIRAQVADIREKWYEKIGIGSSYLFRVDDDAVVDATKKGNLGRLINHCCAPNCTAKIITINGEKKIVIYAKSNIEPGEEITYDYHFPIEQEKIICLCGSSKCRGYLN